MELFELFACLARLHGPSGREQAASRELAKLAGPWADECFNDTMGNLLLHRKGSGPKLLLAAHMDTIGLVATYLEEDGSVRFGKLGGVRPENIRNIPVRFENGTVGAVKVHGSADENRLTLSDLYLDIGAGSREEAACLVKPGDTAVYAGEIARNGNRVISPCLDNRISCAVLLKVLEKIKKCENDLWIVFTVQEEVGLRGAKTAAYGVDPEYAVAVDITGAFDWPGAPRRSNVSLGKGAAIKIMDASCISHPKIVEILTGLAEEKNIRCQTTVGTRGGTDAGAIHQSRLGVITGSVGIPCRYPHTPTETADLRDAEDCISLLAALAEYRLPALPFESGSAGGGTGAVI